MTTPEVPPAKTAPTSDAQPLGRLPVVAVGASAGGLDPTRQFLKELGPAPGAAVVIVHHRLPTDDKRLLELLAHVSELPVTAACSGELLRPDHVYVMPSDAELTVEQRCLQLVERDAKGPPLPIDRLFASLAADPSVFAIGVLLSGAGTDGSTGARAIVASGGIVMAQDASAQFRDMPERAVAVGCADFVLAPAGLAREVLRLVRQQQPRAGTGEKEREALGEILAEVERSTGATFYGYRPSVLEQPLVRRMAVRGVADAKQYAELIRSDTRESTLLRENILACVPSFFREPALIETVKRRVFSRLFARRLPNAALRLWVPGTATGEEAYGLAIALHEYAAERREPLPAFRIFGTDLNERAVAQARTGRFLDAIARDVTPECLRTYFLKEGETYRVRSDIRDACVFGVHDLTRDAPLSRMDFVSCRNVLGCMSDELAKQVVEKFAHSVREQGFLLLGRGETVGEVPGFAVVDREHAIFERVRLGRGRVDVGSDAPAQGFAAAREPPEAAALGAERSASEELRTLAAELEASHNELAVVSREMGKLNLESSALADDLANVLASETLPLVLVGRDRRVRRMTRAAETAFGLAKSSAGNPIASSGALATLLPDVDARIEEVLERLTPLVRVGRGADGKWFECTLRPYVTAGGRIDGVVICAQDIDASKRAAEELERARRYAESIVDTISEGIVVLDPDLRVRSANPAWGVLFGLAPQQVVGRKLDSLGVEVLASPALLAALRGLEPGKSFAAHRLRDEPPQAEPRSFLARARGIENTALTLLTIEDVTAAEEGRAAVRRAELEFRQMLADADEAVIMADAAAQPFFANNAASELFGYAPGEMLASSLRQLLPELDVQRDEATLLRATTGAAHRVVMGRRRDGTEFPARVVVTATARERRPVTVVFVTDVTREREAEQALRSFQERLQSMAFDAALAEERERRRIAIELHDRLGQSLALAQLKLASARANVDGELASAVKYAVALIEQAVTEVRTLTFELSPPILYDLGLRDAISWLAEDFGGRHGLRIDVVDEGVPKRLNDAVSGVVFRSVRELLTNVVKHAGTSNAKVTLRCKHDRFEVEVLDEGAGFAPRPAATASTGGSGLLSVRQQIGRFEGLLEVESVPGRGTRAVIRVPLSAAALAAD